MRALASNGAGAFAMAGARPSRLEPPQFTGPGERLETVLCPHLAHRLRQVVTCGAGSQVYSSRDLLDAPPLARQFQDAFLTRGEWGFTGADGQGGELRIDIASAGMHTADGVGEVGGGGGLGQKSPDPAGQGAVELSGSGVTGDNQHGKVLSQRTQRHGRVNAVHPTQLKVQHTDIGALLPRGLPFTPPGE